MSIYNDYNILVNKKYRLLFNIVFPVLLGTLTSVISFVTESQAVFITVNLMSLICLCADYFGFGCIYKKGSFGMEYVRTSFRGNEVIEHALFLDMIFGMLRVVVFFLFSSIYFPGRENCQQYIIMLCLLIVFLYIVSINVTRYCDAFYSVSCVVVIFSFLQLGILYLFIKYELKMIYAIAVLAVMILISFAITYFHMLTKLRASYID